MIKVCEEREKKKRKLKKVGRTGGKVGGGLWFARK